VPASFRASWGRGDEVEVELQLTSRNWAKLLRGKGLSIRGKGYRYEGDWFWDYWKFGGGLDDLVEVFFGDIHGIDSGAVFSAIARQAMVSDEAESVDEKSLSVSRSNELTTSPSEGGEPAAGPHPQEVRKSGYLGHIEAGDPRHFLAGGSAIFFTSKPKKTPEN
jgi:hypothetical protein